MDLFLNLLLLDLFHLVHLGQPRLYLALPSCLCDPLLLSSQTTVFFLVDREQLLMFLLILRVDVLLAVQQVELLNRPLTSKWKSLHLADQSSQQVSFLLVDIDEPLSNVIQIIRLFLADAISAMCLLDALEASVVVAVLCQIFRFQDPKFREEGADGLLFHVPEDVVWIRAELDVSLEVVEDGQAVHPVMDVFFCVFFELLWIGQLPQERALHCIITTIKQIFKRAINSNPSSPDFQTRK